MRRCIERIECHFKTNGIGCLQSSGWCWEVQARVGTTEAQESIASLRILSDKIVHTEHHSLLGL